MRRGFSLAVFACSAGACDFGATYRLAADAGASATDGGAGLVDASGDGGSSGCGRTFCSRFDESSDLPGLPNSKWSTCSNGFGGIMMNVDDGDALSAPRSLLSVGPDLGVTGQAIGCQSQVFTQAFANATLDFAMKWSVGAGDGGYVNVAELVSSRRSVAIQIRIHSGAPNELKLVEHSFPGGTESYNVKNYGDSPLSYGSWHHVRLAVDEASSPATATLSVDEVALVPSHSLNAISTSANHAEIRVGLPHVQGPVSDCRTRIDDVLFDLK